MASRGEAQTVTYFARDTATGGGKTGDVANHTLRLVVDGNESTPANSPAQVDATNAPGVYKIALSGAELTGNDVVLCGKSSTSDVVIEPRFFSLNRLPVVQPGFEDGLPVCGANGLINAETVTGDVLGNVKGNVEGHMDGDVHGDLHGDVQGKLLGGGSSTIVDVGAWALDGAGEPLATANDITMSVDQAQAGGASTITLASGEPAVTNYYVGRVIRLAGGTGAGQFRCIVAYNGSTKVATVDAAWGTAPDNTTLYAILPTGPVMLAATTHAGSTVPTVTTTGTATAVTTVNGLAAGVITASAIASNAITAAKIATDAIGAAQLASDAVAEIQSGLSTYAGGDTSGVTTLLSRLTSGRASNLDNLDAAISTRSTYVGGDTSGTTTLLSRLTSTRAGYLDNISEAAPTATTIADAVLSRNVSNVESSAAEHTLCTIILATLEAARTSDTTLTIYRTDGSTTHATKTLTQDSDAEPITGIS